MVYRRSMIPVLAALLLAAQQAAAETSVPESPVVAPADAIAAPQTAPTQLTRMEAYDQFRGLYATKRFDEALPLAKRVVELSEADPERDNELPIAYNNLGATQFQLGDYTAAAESYGKSLEILESTQGISSRRLVVPLAGLSAVYAALDQHPLAVQLMERALAVSRRSEGLFNLAQLPLIDQMAISYLALKDYPGAERQYLYALKVAEQNYGYADDRTLPSLLQLATFYESVREFMAARNMYLRGREIAVKESGGFNPLAIQCLVGIARTHRLQYTLDPQSLEGQIGPKEESSAEFFDNIYRESRVPPVGPDRTGLKAVQSALELLRAASDPPKRLLADTLIELGDWYQSSSRPVDALPYYAEAATILETDPVLGNPLIIPRMVVYRPPVSATLSPRALPGQYVLRKVEFRFLITDTGELLDMEVVSNDMSEWQLAQSQRALSRAIYSPRFENGKPVATEDVSFTIEWYEELNAAPSKSSSSGARP